MFSLGAIVYSMYIAHAGLSRQTCFICDPNFPPISQPARPPVQPPQNPPPMPPAAPAPPCAICDPYFPPVVQLKPDDFLSRSEHAVFSQALSSISQINENVTKFHGFEALHSVFNSHTESRRKNLRHSILANIRQHMISTGIRTKLRIRAKDLGISREGMEFGGHMTIIQTADCNMTAMQSDNYIIDAQRGDTCHILCGNESVLMTMTNNNAGTLTCESMNGTEHVVLSNGQTTTCCGKSWSIGSFTALSNDNDCMKDGRLLSLTDKSLFATQDDTYVMMEYITNVSSNVTIAGNILSCADLNYDTTVDTVDALSIQHHVN